MGGRVLICRNPSSYVRKTIIQRYFTPVFRNLYKTGSTKSSDQYRVKRDWLNWLIVEPNSCFTTHYTQKSVNSSMVFYKNPIIYIEGRSHFISWKLNPLRRDESLTRGTESKNGPVPSKGRKKKEDSEPERGKKW